MVGVFHGKSWPKAGKLAPQTKVFTAKPDDLRIPGTNSSDLYTYCGSTHACMHTLTHMREKEKVERE